MSTLLVGIMLLAQAGAGTPETPPIQLHGFIDAFTGGRLDQFSKVRSTSLKHMFQPEHYLGDRACLGPYAADACLRAAAGSEASAGGYPAAGGWNGRAVEADARLTGHH